MAKVKAPLFSESASGTIGGLTYKDNGYGAVVGRRSITPALLTPKQSAHRVSFTLAQHAWITLDENTKTAWNNLAMPPLTGRNLFVGRYSRWLDLELPGIPTPVIHSAETTIEIIRYFWESPGSNLIYMEFHNSGELNNIFTLYTLPTFSHRSTPTPSKMQLTGSIPAYTEEVFFVAKCYAPVCHIQYEIMDIVSGASYGRISIPPLIL
jgi:hypothetical protein